MQIESRQDIYVADKEFIFQLRTTSNHSVNKQTRTQLTSTSTRNENVVLRLSDIFFQQLNDIMHVRVTSFDMQGYSFWSWIPSQCHHQLLSDHEVSHNDGKENLKIEVGLLNSA